MEFNVFRVFVEKKTHYSVTVLYLLLNVFVVCYTSPCTVQLPLPVLGKKSLDIADCCKGFTLPP